MVRSTVCLQMTKLKGNDQQTKMHTHLLNIHRSCRQMWISTLGRSKQLLR